MADFAPVCPVHLLKALDDEGLMGGYHLPLAHDVLAHPLEYAELFDRDTHDIHTVILDNSVIELGTAVDIGTIAKAAEIVRATVIVLPDVLLHTEDTIKNCTDALNTWPIILDKVLGEDMWSFMIVPQGRSLDNWIRCAEHFADHDLIGWWGIPRNFNIMGLGSRYTAAEIVTALNPNYGIHMLGFSNNIADDIVSARHPCVLGIDSAVPIRLGSLGEPMSMVPHDLPPRGNWWDAPETVWTPQMATNIHTMRKWVRT